ncbi:DUF4209 domain-containing protein [Pseudomonas sp. RAC1]|uniref:DUF4209 domain-containing protein n=1 Tax=Pseudomonas sp. RAC1 TaxID=3064900 RepID=UPI00271BEE1B|nr:DUF4209 domain-containing protein [Pseudomonas sp. RAC1]MDV9032289.1 DUF4209 domain-containing protein [Pseudomonas sp. RAC1]
MDKPNHASPLEMLQIIDSLKLSPGMSCSEIMTKLSSAADSELSEVLAWATSMMLDASSAQAPLVPLCRFGTQTSATLDFFSDQDIFCLAAITSEISSSELRARISDIVVLRLPRLVAQAEIAVNAYWQSAQELIAAGEIFTALQRIERGLRLGFRYKKAFGEVYSGLSEYLIDQLELGSFDDQQLKSVRVMYDLRIKDNGWICSVCLNFADRHVDKKSYRIAVSLLELAASCAMSDPELVNKIFRKIADCHLAEARAHNNFMSCACIISAIEALERIPNTRSERDSLYSDLREHQRDWRQYMSSFSIPSPDISEDVADAKKVVAGTDFFDSLFRLVLFVARPSDVSKLRDDALKSLDGNIFAHMGAEHIDHEGLPVAIVPSVTSEEQDEEGIWAQMMQYLKLEHEFMVQARILPALQELSLSYYWEDEFWMRLLRNHPFVPTGHEEYYLRGLNAGLQGDFLGSTHFLIPQVENSLRYILRQKARENTRKFSDGTQERESLSSLLDNEEIVSALGEDAMFGIKAILTDKIYGDLRNQVSHGYVPSNYMYSSGAIFFWWQILQIIMRPFAGYWKKTYG